MIGTNYRLSIGFSLMGENYRTGYLYGKCQVNLNKIQPTRFSTQNKKWEISLNIDFFNVDLCSHSFRILQLGSKRAKLLNRKVD